jgi:hypothetical protein
MHEYTGALLILSLRSIRAYAADTPLSLTQQKTSPAITLTLSLRKKFEPSAASLRLMNEHIILQESKTMNSLTFKRNSAALLVSAMFLGLPLASYGATTPGANQAHDVVEPANSMTCNDGTVFYQTAGQMLYPALCDSHGGVNAGGGSGVGGGNVGNPVIGSPVEVQRRPAHNGAPLHEKKQKRSPSINPAPTPQRAQDYNSSRSNKPSS